MSPSGGAPTNEQIVRLLEAVRAELAEAKNRLEQLALNVERLLQER